MNTDALYTIKRLSEIIKDKDTMNDAIIQVLGGSAFNYTWDWIPAYPVPELLKRESGGFYTILKFLHDKNCDPGDMHASLLHSNYVVANIMSAVDNTCDQIFTTQGITDFLVFRPATLLFQAHTGLRSQIRDEEGNTYAVDAGDGEKIFITYQTITYNIATLKETIDKWLSKDMRKGDRCVIIIPDMDKFVQDSNTSRIGFIHKYTSQGHIIVNHNECLINEHDYLPTDMGFHIDLNNIKTEEVVIHESLENV